MYKLNQHLARLDACVQVKLGKRSIDEERMFILQQAYEGVLA